jgi:hypothetical protein
MTPLLELRVHMVRMPFALRPKPYSSSAMSLNTKRWHIINQSKETIRLSEVRGGTGNRVVVE